MTIVPSLEEQTVEEFSRKLEILSRFAPAIQLDFNDGSFADFKTVTVEDVVLQILDFRDKVNFEAHLMVQKPYDYIPKLLESGVKKIYIQYEIEANIRDLLDEIEKEECLVGLSIGPQTPVSDLEPFLDMVDCVNIMSINTGKQGQPFLPETLNKITDLRNIGFDLEIALDGGLNSETIVKALQFPVDTLVVGHYIGESENPEEAYNGLLELVKFD